MSASEKLKALEARQDYEVRDIIERVLPQIVAVVEAAEGHVESPGALAADKKHSDLRAALTALEEALGGDVISETEAKKIAWDRHVSRRAISEEPRT